MGSIVLCSIIHLSHSVKLWFFYALFLEIVLHSIPKTEAMKTKLFIVLMLACYIAVVALFFFRPKKQNGPYRNNYHASQTY